MGIRSQLLGILVAPCLSLASMAHAQRVFPIPSEITGGTGKSVKTISVQDDGRVLVGGRFDSITGVARKNLARLKVDGSVDASWSVPGIDGDVTVVASSEDRVFFGGRFTHVAGQTRLFLAAVDRATGALLDWNPSPTVPGTAIDELRAMLVSTDGSVVHVTGLFSRIGGQNVSNFASLDSQTGALDDEWAGDTPSKRGYSLAIARDGDSARDVLYVGGDTGIAAVDTSTGTENWHVDTGSPVRSMAFFTIPAGPYVVAAGRFASDGSGYQSVAIFHRRSGNRTFWNPMPNGTVNTIAIHDDKVLLSGDFIDAGGQPRSNIAQIPVPRTSWSEQATDWYPAPGADRPISAMGVSKNTIFVGGLFTRIGGEDHYGIAAIATSELIFGDDFDGIGP